MEGQLKIEQQISEFISKNSHADVSNITPQTLLFQEGIFDSMGFILLIDFLEGQFSIKANDSDLIEENFESIKAITGYIQKKQLNNH